MASSYPEVSALADLRLVEIPDGDVATRLTARILADFGAEVLQYDSESAESAELDRRVWHDFLDAGKRTIPAGNVRQLAEALSRADLLIIRNGFTLAREAESAARANGDLVRLKMSPLGSFGKLSRWKAGDLAVCALGGVSIILGEKGKPPLHFPFCVPAFEAAFHAAAAALVALWARDHDGPGQEVDIAASDVLANYALTMSLFIRGSGGKWARRGFARHGPIYPSGFYPCKDGYIFLATQSRRQWAAFLELMGHPDWVRENPAFGDGVAIGWKHADEVDVHFIPWLLQFTRRALVEKARGVDGLILGPINSVHELLDDEHLEARRFWNVHEYGGREVRLPRFGYALSSIGASIGPAPAGIEKSPAEFWNARPARREPKSPCKRALDGVRVIEFGWNLAGPLVGQMLADFGAEVIKVESRHRQDYMRHWAHARAFFNNAHRNKRAVAVDISKSEGARMVRELARVSDIVFDNFAAGVMDHHGLGYEDLRKVNPRLVVLSMAMGGQSGPLRHLRGFATTATGFGGLENSIGYPGLGPTGLPMLGLGDFNAAIQSVVAVLAALRHRERTGEGQFIDLSQIEAASSLSAEELIRYQVTGERWTPRANAVPYAAPHGVYPAAGEDRWIAISVDDPVAWRALVGAMGSPGWAISQELYDVRQRLARCEEIDRAIAQWTSSQDRDGLAAALQAAGVAAAPVLELDEVSAHPHFVERGIESWLEDAAAPEGRWRMCSTPWHLSATARQVLSPAPALGEHNEYFFRTVLGLGSEEYERLVAEGVLT